MPSESRATYLKATIEPQTVSLVFESAIREHFRECAVFAQKARRAFRTNSFRARQLVRRITSERDKIGHLFRFDPVPLANLCGADACHLASAHRLENRG